MENVVVQLESAERAAESAKLAAEREKRKGNWTVVGGDAQVAKLAARVAAMAVQSTLLAGIVRESLVAAGLTACQELDPAERTGYAARVGSCGGAEQA